MSHLVLAILLFSFFFFNYTATTEIYTLSLHDALPILIDHIDLGRIFFARLSPFQLDVILVHNQVSSRSEEHTSELQSHSDLVCRLLLEKKKKPKTNPDSPPRSLTDSMSNAPSSVDRNK